MVVMKLMPVSIDEKPSTNAANTASEDIGAGLEAERGVEGPARVRRAAAGKQRQHGENRARHVEVPGRQVQPGERDVFGPDENRQEEVAEDRGQAGNHEQEDHDDAMDREHGVVGLGGDQVLERGELDQPHHEADAHADEEETGRRVEIEQANPLVVRGRQPGHQPFARAGIHQEARLDHGRVVGHARSSGPGCSAPALPADEDDEDDGRDHGDGRGHGCDGQDEPASLRVVPETDAQELRDRRTRLVARRLQSRHLDIGRHVRHAVHVAGHGAFRADDDDCGGVDEIVPHPLEVEAHRVGERPRGRRIAGQEPPRRRRKGPLDLGQVVRPLLGRDLGGVALVEADGQDLEIPAGNRVGPVGHVRDRVELRRADAGAPEVVEREQRGLVDERSQRHRVPGLVAQHEIQRERRCPASHRCRRPAR